MSISIICTYCGKHYTVSGSFAGKRAKCKKCGTTLEIPAEDAPTPAETPFTDLAALADSVENSTNAQTIKPAVTKPASGPNDSALPSGPTDKQFRIGAAVGLPIFILGIGLCVATWEQPDIARLLLIAFGPFAVSYSIAALIDPNFVRAAGKFGTHLPFRYKLIAGLFGVGGLMCSLLLAMYLMMF